MTEFRINIIINKSIDVVVRAFLEPKNIVHWTKYLERFEVVKGEVGMVGSVARLHYLEDGKRYVMEDRLIFIEPGKKYVSEVSGDALEARVETTFEQAGDGTRMTVFWSGKAKVISLKILFPFLRSRITKGARSELETFKGLVETRGVDFSKSL